MTWMVGTRKGLFVFDGDEIVNQKFVGEPVTAVLVDQRDNNIYVALNHGHFGQKLHRSTDGGATFDEITAPTFPSKPDDLVDMEPMRQIPTPWNVELIWSLEAAHRDEPGGLWCGTIPGGLFRSDDHGDSWHLVDSLWNDERRAQWMGGGYDFPGIHSVVVDPRAAGHVPPHDTLMRTWPAARGSTTTEWIPGKS